MNAKKANWAFLLTVIAYFLVSFLMLFLPDSVSSSLMMTNLILECTLALPIIILAIVSREKLGEFLGFHKIKPGTVLMIGLFTFLTSPFLTLVNGISMFWTENEAANMMESYQIGNIPFVQLLLSTAVIAPICEELTCRGGFYRSYRRSGSAVKAMLLSALLFACIHMNFNQASYAFVMGVIAILLVEASGSIWSSVIYHGLFNAGTSLIAYITLRSNPNAYAEQEVTTELLMYGVGVYLIIAAVTLPIAFAVLIWISKHENREGFWKNARRESQLQAPSEDGLTDEEEKTKKDKLITIPLILALILCLLVMTGVMSAVIEKLVVTLS